MSLSQIKVNNQVVTSVDNEPTFESNNLIESAGVEKYLAKNNIIMSNPEYSVGYINIYGIIDSTSTDYSHISPILLKSNHSIVLNLGNELYLGYNVAVIYKTDDEGNFIESLLDRGTGDSFRKVKYTNNTQNDMYIGICTYINERNYIIQNCTEAAPLFISGYMSITSSNQPDNPNKIISNAPKSFIPTIGYTYLLKIYQKNTADACTLNINETGVKKLYYNNSRLNNDNTWEVDSYNILTYDGEDYHIFPLQTTQEHKWTEDTISNLGITSSSKLNAFLKELYLFNIDTNQEYCLSYVRNDATTNIYSFSISASNNLGYKLAQCYINDAVKYSFVIVEERNNSGISGYAVVDWNFIEMKDGDIVQNTPKVYIKNEIVSNLDYNPRIASYLKDNEQDNAIENLRNSIPTGFNNSTSNDNIYVLANNIKTNRSYFLNNTYVGEISYDDSSYLDAKLRSIPDGKHFIFSTDSHIDYYSGVGLRQKDTEIMSYIKAKLNCGAVVFGGDCIGTRNSSYEAAKVLSIYANDKFDAFGADFVWCQGNHDANYVSNVPGGNRVPSVEIYKRTTGIMDRYGIIQFDTEGIDIINNTSATPEEKEMMIAWWKLHYYYDDRKNKIRFIVCETGDLSDGINAFTNGHADGWETMISYIPFIGNALETCPDGWDVVAVMHQMSTSGSTSGNIAFDNGVYSTFRKGIGCLYSLFSAFKLRTSVTITEDGSITSDVNPIMYNMMHTRIGNGGVTYNYSNRTSGRCFMISGHFHFDDAWIVQNERDISQSWYYGGKEYGQLETILPNAILHIQTDRAVVVDQGGNGIYNPKWPHAYSYPNDKNIVADPKEEDVVRFGTVTEVLFDVVTITDDNKVVCTRIGGGSDRIYDLP